MSETETRERCGYSIAVDLGEWEPCDRPATGWRWYQDVEHEPCLEAACSIHENVGGNRMHAAEAEVERLTGLLAVVDADRHAMWTEAKAELSRLRGVVEAVQALAGEWESRAGARSARPKSRIDIHEAADALRAVLAPVSSSGEAESGEWEGNDLPTPDEALRMGWWV